jgi:AraC family transcriptional regulator
MSSVKNPTEIKLFESISSDYLFTSDFYEIKNWSFDFKKEGKLSTGFNDCFCIVFIRNGNLHIDLASREYDMHIGHVVIEKANYEYRLRPTIGECSIFNFTPSFYEQLVHDYDLKKSFFFSKPNILSLLLNSSPEIDYLHHQIMKGVSESGKLEIDSLVLALVQQITGCITDKAFDGELPSSLKRNHIGTIEKAKAYMHEKFADDISLRDLADHCHVSPFHFCRIFKKFTAYSPHQYLMNIRLKHAEMLLRNTMQPITDICFTSGFNSLEHFATMFKQKYRLNPTQYRKE